jgi:hypothetical protein
MIETRRLRLFATLFIALGCAGPAQGEDGENVNAEELVLQMGWMQRYLHKLDLSVQAGNRELAGFYIHELEELIDALADAGVVYHGDPVGAMTRAQLTPVVEALEAALDQGGDADAAVGALVDRCNDCHAATGRAWLRMTRAGGNPFNQDFEP